MKIQVPTYFWSVNRFKVLLERLELAMTKIFEEKNHPKIGHFYPKFDPLLYPLKINIMTSRVF